MKSRGTEEATPALGSEDGSAPRTPGTPIQRPAAPQAPQTSTAGPQSPGLAATCRLRAFQARSPDQPPTPTPGVGGQSLGLEVTVKVTALSPSQPRLQEGLKPPPTWNLLCFQEVPGPPRAPPRGAPGCLRTCLDRPGMHHPCFCRGGAAVAPAHIALCRAPAHPSNPAPLGPLAPVELARGLWAAQTAKLQEDKARARLSFGAGAPCTRPSASCLKC